MNERAAQQTIDIRGESDPQFLTVDGVDVAYRRSGSGVPVVFLHGMGLSNSWLESHALLAEKVDLIAPQLPGFGRTQRPAWHRSVDDFVPLLADFLTQLGVERFHLVGHSLGGLIAGAFGAAYPERLLSLTVVAPLPLPTVRAPELDGSHDGPAPANLMAMLFNDNEAAYAEYDPPEDLGLFVGPADDEFSAPESFSLDPAPALYRRLARITAPAQVIVPDVDHVVGDSSVFSTWAKWLGDAPVVKISSDTESTGHMVTVQEPQRFADAITTFVAYAEKSS